MQLPAYNPTTVKDPLYIFLPLRIPTQDAAKHLAKVCADADKATAECEAAEKQILQSKGSAEVA